MSMLMNATDGFQGKNSVTGPLHGIRIVDITAVLMGPYATQTLGDMGADVIKVESPGGDITRQADSA